MASPYVWDQATSTWITASAAGVAVSPLTTKGDVWGYSTTDARIPVGTDGDVLTADSTQALGLKWAAGGGSGVSSLDSITGAVTLVAGSNVTITDNSPSAGDITIAASGGGGGAWTQLASGVLASAAANIDITGISSAYNHLSLILLMRGTAATGAVNMRCTFNGDTGTNYNREDFGGSGSSVSASPASSQTFAFLGNGAGASDTANVFGMAQTLISFYANTSTYKVCQSQWTLLQTLGSTGTYTNAFEGNVWSSTAAINEITITPNTGNWDVGSSYTLYGIL